MAEEKPIRALDDEFYKFPPVMQITKCPVCYKDTFKYYAKINANKCQSEFCGWDDKVGPVLEPLAIPYLEFCLSKAHSEYHKTYISKVIEVTKKLEEAALIS